jgi:hypothetical protein
MWRLLLVFFFQWLLSGHVVLIFSILLIFLQSRDGARPRTP